MRPMNKDKVIKYFGDTKAVAKALDVTTQYVYQWGEIVPEVVALKLERISEGGLQYKEKDYR